MIVEFLRFKYRHFDKSFSKFFYGVYNIGRCGGRTSEDRRGNRSDGISDFEDRQRRFRRDRRRRDGDENSDFEEVVGKLFLHWVHLF